VLALCNEGDAWHMGPITRRVDIEGDPGGNTVWLAPSCLCAWQLSSERLVLSPSYVVLTVHRTGVYPVKIFR
jgi:hypothetical protein